MNKQNNPNQESKQVKGKITVAEAGRRGGSQKLQSMVGIVTQDFVPWKEWINGWVNDLYTKQYNKLKAEGKITLNSELLQQEAAQEVCFEEGE